MGIAFTSMEGVDNKFSLSAVDSDAQVPVFSSKVQQIFRDEMRHVYTAD